MKKILLLGTLLVISTICFASQQQLLSYLARENAAGGISCSGDFSDGDPEDFEHGSGDGNFCTTDWTVSDTDGVVDTANASNSKCNSNSCAITYDSDSGSTNYIQANLGSVDNDCYIRFFCTIPDVPDWANTRPFSCGQDATPESNRVVGLKLQDKNTGGTTARLYLWGTSDSANYYDLTEGSLYRIEIHIVKNSTCTIRVYDSGGSAVNHDGAGAETTVTGFNLDVQYFHWHDDSDNSTACTGYIDCVEYDASSWVGDQTC